MELKAIRIIVFILCYMVYPACSIAFEFNPSFRHLNLEHGLSQSRIYDIAQDQQGFMWFATQDGLNRYDGYDFKVFNHDDDPLSIPHNLIYQLTVDQQGRLWLGSLYAGLSYYNPSTLTFHRVKLKSPQQQKVINTAGILSMTETSSGQLVLGTWNEGLLIVDIMQGSLKQYHKMESTQRGFYADRISALLFENDENLWIGTEKNGLYSLNITTEEFTHYRPGSANFNSISHHNISSLFLDADKNLWIGMDTGGINKLDRKTQKFIAIKYKNRKSDKFIANGVSDIENFDDEHLIVATTSGLNIIHKKTLAVQKIEHIVGNRKSLSGNSISCIFKATKDIFWIGTKFSGINILDIKTTKFNHYRYHGSYAQGVKSNKISSFYQSNRGQLWIGSRDNGVFRYDFATNSYRHYMTERNNQYSLSNNDIVQIIADRNNSIWIATFGGGLEQYDETLNGFKHYKPSRSIKQGVESDRLLRIYEDSNGQLWVASRYEGLLLFNKKNGEFREYIDPDGRKIAGTSITSFLEFPGDNLLLGSYNSGVRLINLTSKKILDNSITQRLNRVINNKEIVSLLYDSKNRIWIGGSGTGLISYDLSTSSISIYKKKHGLPNSEIYGILEDNEGYIWVSTNKGLAKFDSVIKRFKNYDASDGLQSNEFNSNAYYKNKEGKLFFGGINGYNSFYPKDIHLDTRLPAVVITDMLLFNQSVFTNTAIDNGAISDDRSIGNSIIEEGIIKNKNHIFDQQNMIADKKPIILSYPTNLFTFAFSALHYENPLKNKYMYRLEGWDSEWINSDARFRRATYTNIPAGDYLFRVKAANPDDAWNEDGVKIALRILPPPWKTWWAYSIYLFLIVIILCIIMQWLSAKNKIEKERLELKKEREYSKRLKEVDILRDEFLANTSHEIRTPLNGIIGLSEILMDRVNGVLPSEDLQFLSMITVSGKRLAHLVNDILDFAKLKNNSIDLQWQEVNLYSLTNVIITLSASLVKNKDVELINNIPTDLPTVAGDENRLQQVLYNLIGNAIKFTKIGSVNINAILEANKIAVTVTDTGIGIPLNKQQSIFEYFEQADGKIAREYAGTGLGLAVTKKLVKLHGSDIWVKSLEKFGSTFGFYLNLYHEITAEQRDDNKANYEFISNLQTQSDNSSANKVMIDKTDSNSITNMDGDENSHLQSNDIISHQLLNENVSYLGYGEQDITLLDKILPCSSFHILVVDDDNVARHVVHGYLKNKNYSVTEAVDGEDALQIIGQRDDIDLVLLDIMMPGISGYDVCKRIRERWTRDKMPILFLTSNNSQEEIIEGYKFGCNDFLVKPVSKHELQARVQTHLELKMLYQDFEKNIGA